MRELIGAGNEIIVRLQQWSPALDAPFRIITMLGEELALLVVVPVVYWCLDRRAGARAALLFNLSTYVNLLAKSFAAQPRPFEYDPRIRQLCPAQGSGFPSGHTQNTVVVWGYLAAALRRRWVQVAASVLLVLVPLSRLYLGVHSPLDLIGGYLLGLTVLALHVMGEPALSRGLQAAGLAGQFAVAVGGTVLLAILAPDGNSRAAELASAFFGLAVGFAFERRYVRFATGRGAAAKSLRMLLGVPVLALLYLMPRPAWFAPLLPTRGWRVLRSALAALWGSFGAPWCFVRLRLAPRERAEEESLR